jgi:D-glycero-D-manno-heptose 1,7-bisphosphate phosphatase
VKKAAFLDRDGTINADRGYVYRKEDFMFLPGAVDGMRRIEKLGYRLIIITNQSGIGRGYYTESDYKKLEEWMLRQLKAQEVSVTAVYYCPHHPRAAIQTYARICNCRKPGTGLFEQAVREHHVDMSQSVVIGDKMRDLAICAGTSAKGFLIYCGQQQKRADGIRQLKGGLAEVADILETYEDMDESGYQGKTRASGQAGEVCLPGYGRGSGP